MSPTFIVLLVAAIAAWLAWRHLRRARRRTLLAAAPPRAWIRFLEDNVPLYCAMPRELREQLHGHMNVFLDEKRFVGCAGLEVSDEMRLTIAAQACMLLLNRKVQYYRGFKTILVYPDTYVAKQVRHDGWVEVTEDHAREGEAWHRGPLVLSWNDVKRDLDDPTDGHNVVLHEFAHKLDEENEHSDGLPVLDDPEQYPAWASILNREYDWFREDVEHDAHTVMDDYGAVSPSEFFAVVTETFFEKPQALSAHHPELYEQFKRFYRVDPVEWSRHEPTFVPPTTSHRLH